jgi:TFIIF-interacting CTD phosphatase-like protein
MQICSRNKKIPYRLAVRDFLFTFAENIKERYEKENVIMGSNNGCGVVDGAGDGGGAREERELPEG